MDTCRFATDIKDVLNAYNMNKDKLDKEIAL